MGGFGKVCKLFFDSLPLDPWRSPSRAPTSIMETSAGVMCRPGALWFWEQLEGLALFPQ